MRYTSTRSNDIDCSFEEALTSGYAADGGLFVPRTLPVLTTTLLNEWSNLSYPALMQQFMRLFISSDEVTDGELQTVCEAALAGFDDPRHAVPIVPMVVGANNINETSFFVSELFHGPTFCFKDLGMRAVVQLLSLFATKRNRPITLLVSTTGDTGPAAVQAVADNHPSVGGGGNPKQQLLKLLVHYPHKQISNFQRLQLTTVASPCVQVVAFEGGGDDMDEPIKQLLASKKTTRPAAAAGSNDTTTTNNNNNEDDNKTSLWTGVNSYNIGRPITQMVHYVWTYLRVAEQKRWVLPNDLASVDIRIKVDFILPTGAMGNIASGYMVQRMGLPVGKLVAAVNVNDIIHTTFQTGAFHRSDTLHRTLSEAINIQVPYNFERLVYLTDGNAAVVKSWYQDLADTSRIDLNAGWLSRLQRDLNSARVTDEQMCTAAKMVYSDYKYLTDPHTAVAFSAAYQLGYLVPGGGGSSGENKISNSTDGNELGAATTHTTSGATALLATASPCKFEHSVTTAVGSEIWQEYFASDQFPAAAKRILDLPERPPIVYPAGTNLKATQRHWEELARHLVAKLEQHDE